VTSAAAAAHPAVKRDRLAVWCGWVMVGAGVLIPLLAWVAPLGFAPLMALMGLLCLPAVRMADEDRPVLIVLLGALVWAAASTVWSPWKPKSFESNGVVQLALALPLYFSAICGARRAEPNLNALALRIAGVGLALVGAVLILDMIAGGRVYGGLYEAVYGRGVRVDIAKWNSARAAFMLAVLWPVVLAGGVKRGPGLLLLAFAVIGQGWAAHVLGADAAVMAIPAALAAILLVWKLPTGGPRLMAAAVAIAILIMPLAVWALRAFGRYGELEGDVQFTWAARLSYWSHAVDWIARQPLRGWGLDASRAMGPGITLHPHNNALQVWLELGLPGAVSAAVFWGLCLTRLSRRQADPAMVGVAGSAAAYLLFAGVSFGMWQAWWVALGALIPVLAAMRSSCAVSPKST
jgi:O-antigen ligase